MSNQNNYQAAAPDLVEFLLNKIDLDGMETAEEEKLWVEMQQIFGRDDYVRLANILVTLDNMPAALKQKIWDNI